VGLIEFDGENEIDELYLQAKRHARNDRPPAEARIIFGIV